MSCAFTCAITCVPKYNYGQKLLRTKMAITLNKRAYLCKTSSHTSVYCTVSASQVTRTHMKRNRRSVPQHHSKRQCCFAEWELTSRGRFHSRIRNQTGEIISMFKRPDSAGRLTPKQNVSGTDVHTNTRRSKQ